MLNPTDFKSKKGYKDKEGQYILIIDSIQQEDITIMNIYIPNNSLSKYNQQKFTVQLKGEIVTQ